MNPSLFRALRRIGLGLLAVMAAQAMAMSADISGEYADAGVVVEDPSAQFHGRVSLHALLALQLDAKTADVLHEETDRVGLWAGDREVELRVRNRDGEVFTRARWRWVGGERLQAVCRGADGEYVFAFEPVEGGRLLRVVLARKDTTLFGPAVQTVGVFVFARTT